MFKDIGAIQSGNGIDIGAIQKQESASSTDVNFHGANRGVMRGVMRGIG